MSKPECDCEAAQAMVYLAELAQRDHPPSLGLTTLQPCRGERACPYGRPHEDCEGRQWRGTCPHFGERILWAASAFGRSARRFYWGYGVTPEGAVSDLKRRMEATDRDA